MGRLGCGLETDDAAVTEPEDGGDGGEVGGVIGIHSGDDGDGSAPVEYSRGDGSMGCGVRHVSSCFKMLVQSAFESERLMDEFVGLLVLALHINTYIPSPTKAYSIFCEQTSR